MTWTRSEQQNKTCFLLNTKAILQRTGRCKGELAWPSFDHKQINFSADKNKFLKFSSGPVVLSFCIDRPQGSIWPHSQDFLLVKLSALFSSKKLTTFLYTTLFAI